MIAKTEKVISAIVPIQNGHLILLPYPAAAELDGATRSILYASRSSLLFTS